jgi:hypothetical protein
MCRTFLADFFGSSPAILATSGFATRASFVQLDQFSG